MRIIIQKSGPAKVEIDQKIHNEISGGLVILLGITSSDTEKDIDYLVEKITNLRLFPESEKFFEKSILETNQEILLISQFTLYASCNKGRRPDFMEAAKPDIAKPLYQKFAEKLTNRGLKVKTGIFGADMNISLINQGPITIIIESRQNKVLP